MVSSLSQAHSAYSRPKQVRELKLQRTLLVLLPQVVELLDTLRRAQFRLLWLVSLLVYWWVVVYLYYIYYVTHKTNNRSISLVVIAFKTVNLTALNSLFSHQLSLLVLLSQEPWRARSLCQPVWACWRCMDCTLTAMRTGRSFKFLGEYRQRLV